MTDEPLSGRFEGREHRLPVRIYYEDTDFSGIVYHANYVRYFERGRSDFLRLAGVSHTELRRSEQPIAFAVVKLNIRFRKAARIDDALVVHTAYRALRGPVVLVEQSLWRGDELIAEAQVEVVCTRADGRAVRMPKAVAERLRPWFSTPG